MHIDNIDIWKTYSIDLAEIAQHIYIYIYIHIYLFFVYLFVVSPPVLDMIYLNVNEVTVIKLS